jgi:pectin methylesterase-like acyl-CoA thioesterase
MKTLVLIYCSYLLCLAVFAGNVRIDGESTIYSSIQDALNAADPGDQLNVSTGVFAEAVDVYKNLTIIGGYDTNCQTRIGGE